MKDSVTHTAMFDKMASNKKEPKSVGFPKKNVWLNNVCKTLNSSWLSQNMPPCLINREKEIKWGTYGLPPGTFASGGRR